MARLDRGNHANAVGVRQWLSVVNLCSPGDTAAGRRRWDLRRGHLFGLQHLSAASQLLHAGLRAFLSRVRRSDQADNYNRLYRRQLEEGMAQKKVNVQ